MEHEELTDTSEVVATGQVMVFLGEHFVTTVRRGEHAQLSSLRRTMEADPTRFARGPSEVLYAIADKIIDDYLKVVAEFEKDVDEIETRVFAQHDQREVERVYQLKRELIEFKRYVMPLGARLLRLATRELPGNSAGGQGLLSRARRASHRGAGSSRLVRRGAEFDPAGRLRTSVGC